MSKAKRRKLNTAQKHQASAQYTPVTRLRKNALYMLDFQLMRDSFLINTEYIWQLTSNCRIVASHDNFLIRLNWRGQCHNKQGKRVNSKVFDTIIQAENMAFDFRYNLESKYSKENIDAYKSNLILTLSGSAPISSPSNINDTEIIKPRYRGLSSALRKSYDMSGSLVLNLKSNSSKKPRTHPPNFSHFIDKCLVSNFVRSSSAKTAQRAMINKEMKYSSIKLKKTIVDQTYRMKIINYLSHHISAGTCELLLLGSEDPEVLASFSPFDRSHVTRKAIHIADAL